MKNPKMTHITSENLEVEYTYWNDGGTYYDSPENVIEIDKLKYNGTDITELLFDIAEPYIREVLTEKLEQINK
jgi:hypothetical protein|tara:strand:- start:851 stop:1069 length:219 start_codon:yes stop_codon:yes gene_type:complete